MKIISRYEVGDKEKLTNEEIIKILLKNRQISDKKEFLNPADPSLIHLQDFHKSYKNHFKKVVKILTEIKKSGQMIVVYTDYDADGITGGAILWETLHLLKFNVMPYVPDRKSEGYGFSKKGIDNIIKQFHPALIISVDHGITKIKEIEYARKNNIKVIVTDHHLKTDKNPTAEAIFHIPALSGAGVSYFFAKEIFNYFEKQAHATSQVAVNHFKSLTTNFESDYLALAAIGIIADLVPLIGPARSVVKYGLRSLTKTRRVGLRHIIKQAGITNRDITPYEVGFIIAPRINAAGRLGSAIDALRLLCTKKEEKAFHLAHKVGKTNVERQLLVQKSVEEAKAQIDKAKLSKIIVLTSDRWHEGIIGLIASKIADQFYRPTIVLTKNDGFYKASARSIPDFNITQFLRGLKKYLVDVGGHKAAAGFTIEKEKLSLFSSTAIKKANRLIKEKDLERKIEVDLKIPLAKINLSLVKTLETLQPFGMGNSRPVFYSQAEIVDAKIFGKSNSHLKIFVQQPNNHSPITNNQTLELISFNNAGQFTHLSRGKTIDVVYRLEINRWGGKENLRGTVNFFDNFEGQND